MSSKSSFTPKSFGSLKVTNTSEFKIGSTSGSPVTRRPAPVTVATGNATLTAVQVKAGVILQTPAANSALTLPTAALLVASIPSATVGDSIDISIINLAAVTFTSTLVADASGSLVGVGAVAPLGSALFRIRITSVTASAEAYVVYAL